MKYLCNFLVVCLCKCSIKSYIFLKKLALAILFLDCTYLGGIHVEYQPEHRLSWLNFLVIFHSLSRVGHEYCLPVPFQFVIIIVQPFEDMLSVTGMSLINYIYVYLVYKAIILIKQSSCYLFLHHITLFL
jgi:hypothetical protein